MNLESEREKKEIDGTHIASASGGDLPLLQTCRAW
jgi:hypothetical protein